MLAKRATAGKRNPWWFIGLNLVACIGITEWHWWVPQEARLVCPKQTLGLMVVMIGIMQLCLRKCFIVKHPKLGTVISSKQNTVVPVCSQLMCMPKYTLVWAHTIAIHWVWKITNCGYKAAVFWRIIDAVWPKSVSLDRTLVLSTDQLYYSHLIIYQLGLVCIVGISVWHALRLGYG